MISLSALGLTLSPIMVRMVPMVSTWMESPWQKLSKHFFRMLTCSTSRPMSSLRKKMNEWDVLELKKCAPQDFIFYLLIRIVDKYGSDFF